MLLKIRILLTLIDKKEKCYFEHKVPEESGKGILVAK